MGSLQQNGSPFWRGEYGREVENDSTDVENSELVALLSHSTSGESASDSSASIMLLVLIGLALLAGIIVKQFDIAFLATNYPHLASDLQHFKDAPWIMLTASICSAIFVPLYSYLLKAFGVRQMMLLAYASFALGLLFCALSTSFWELTSSRFALGFGSSGITLLSMIVINDIVGVRQLAMWESFVTCVEMGTSMAAGPLGAWMYRSFGWHSVFYLEFILAVMGFCLVYISFTAISRYPHHAPPSLLKKGDTQLARIDVEGWLLLILAVTVPLIAVTLGDNGLSWTHPVEMTLLISSPLLACSFILFEAKVAKNPIMNMTPIFKVEYLRVLLQVFGVISILNAVVFVIPPYAEVRAFDGFDTPSFEDWALTCVFLGFPVGAISGGYLIKANLVSVQRIMLANAVALQCFCVLFAVRIIKPELEEHAPLLVGFGTCTGAWQSCLLFSTLSSTEKRWWPQTLALYYLVETFGGDLGIALMSTITRTVTKSGIRSSLGDSDATEQIIKNALEDLQSLRQLDDGIRTKVLAAFEYAMHTSFFFPCALAAVVIVMAFSMNISPSRVESSRPPSADQEDGLYEN